MGGVASAMLFCTLSFAQNFTGGFSYVFPHTDTASTRFIPQFRNNTISDQDFVTIDQSGHFSIRGAPVKFFGVNLVADAAFPATSKAWFIAGRMRKMGFNLVRFHHLDNPWSAGSLFEKGWTTRQLNPVTLDRLEFLLAELKKNGIYSNINLHVSRTFNSMDGLPDTDSLQEFGKAINYFDPWVLTLHKEYAGQLLTHVNPYTGKALAADPAMAMVEITNENSLYRYWRDNKLKYFSAGGMLTARHVRMLDSLWVGFLKAKYGSTSNLALAWNTGASGSDGANRIVNGTFETSPPSTGWTLEMIGTAASMRRDSLVWNTGAYSARVEVSATDGTDWHMQWKQIGLSVVKDSTYTITFAARSDSSRAISVSLTRDVSPWTWYGGMSITLTPGWKTYTFSVHAPESAPGLTRLTFGLGAQQGTFWFDDITMVSTGTSGLLPDESLEASAVRRIDYAQCPVFTDARVRDMSAFYIGLESDYFAKMRSYLKDTLGVRVPIVGTNWNIGPADMVVQSKLDYIDNHAYWDHPTFPGVPWSTTDWYITNTPVVQNTQGGTPGYLFGAIPVAGKPFTVSEYNHPFPNRYQSEGPLFLTAYSAFHGADALMFFDYNSVDDWESDRIADYFSIHRNSAMMALMPSCAAAFRQKLVTPAVTTLSVNYAPDDYLTLPRRDNSGWLGVSLIDRTLALRNAVRTVSFSSQTAFDPSSLPAAPTNPFVSDTREITWNTAGIMTVAAPRFVAATGLLNNFVGLRAGPFQLNAATGFGTLTWTSLTPDSLSLSRLSLVTISTTAQNSGMVWDGTTTVHDAWGTAPTLVAPMLLIGRLRIQADSIRVYPLDPLGRETKGWATYLPTEPNVFTVLFHQAQMTSMWFGIESFGNGATSWVGELAEAMPFETELDQNYPNPFNGISNFEMRISKLGRVRVEAYDLLGRKVATILDAEKMPGRYTVRFDAGALASGTYVVRLEAGGEVRVRRMVLIR